jgi:UDP-N-acetylmuramyl pentapeptide phosphotransferase/UDP-N-acetylglucosamine-1-phosphate transferase
MSQLTFAILASLVVGLAVLRILLLPRMRSLALDQPNERSLHAKVVPRTGGLAVLVASSTALLFASSAATIALASLAGVLAGVSFIDDRRGLSVRVRLLVQLAAALGASLWVCRDAPAWWVVLGTLGIVWMTNLYNFMDGADGLAGGMGLTGFGSYAAAAALNGDTPLAVLAAAIAAGCVAFLTRNYPPASIFMGDAGSTVLGFLAASAGLYGNARGLWPLWFPLLVFLPFVLDATVTLTRRAVRRDRIWKAHREHNYQRLIRSGWSHRDMAMVAHGCMLGTGALALLLLRRPAVDGWVALTSATATLGCGMYLVDARWSAYLEAQTQRNESAVSSAQSTAPVRGRVGAD